MNYNHLYYFYMVVREGGVSAASRHLHVSQPSLSSQIKSFEKNLDSQLFERRGNRLELTAAGKAVYANAAQMFEISASIPGLVKTDSKKNASIKLGIADEIERPFAVNLVRNFFQKFKIDNYPGVTLTSGLNEDLLNKLRSWAVDVVITNQPSSFNDLEITGTMVMPIFFAIGYTSKMKGANAIICSQRELVAILKNASRGFALPISRLKLREETDSFLSRVGETCPIVFESDTLATIIRAIIDNVGVGFIPLPYISREVLRREITVIGPKEGWWKHTLYLMTKKGRAAAPGLAEIFQSFEDLKEDTENISEKISFKGKIEAYLKHQAKTSS